MTTKSSFTGLYLPYKPSALPFECPPWAIAGSGLGFVRLIRLFPFSSESGVDELKFSPTATEK